ncbi:hypothetical protein BOX15_Mlig021310g1 [Macrostomum lignano]|uniref:Uncharacterized protein n=1 Tax=Macrostomum lignano TaxID=282301 RepID=A0A267F663_9PLAT|nr:hypothetical protein BOX15_Mlig021310g1 [Macrostomum lignano]
MEPQRRELILLRPMYMEAEFRADDDVAYGFYKTLSDALVLNMPCLRCYPLHLEKVHCREDRLVLRLGPETIKIDLVAMRISKKFMPDVERVFERLQEAHDELVMSLGALKLPE